MKTKKNIVVFAGDFYPKPSPNGVCLTKIIEGLKDCYNFTVVMINQVNSEANIHIDGVECINITCLTNRIQNYASNVGGIRGKVLQLISKVLRGAKTAIAWMRYEGFYYRGCIKATKNLLKKQPIDCVIAACYPFPAIYAAYKASKMFGLEYLTYILDDYSSAKNLRKFCLFRKRFEKKDMDTMKDVMVSAKFNFISEGFKHSKIFADIEKEVRNKVVGFPLLDVNMKSTAMKSYHDVPHIVFTGSFVRGVREPESLMHIFSFKQTSKVKLTLCTRGDYQGVLSQWARDKENIDYKGTVTREMSMQIMESADILLNVDNKNLHQIPSKVFEYMQTGKPIINLYYFEEQKSLLESYPNVLQINQNNITDDDVKKLVKFCFENLGKICDTSVICEKYKIYTKQFLVDVFKKEIEA